MSGPDAIEEVFPLTPLQEGLLFHAVYAPGGGEYHDQFSAVLRGPLQPALLAEAWSAVVAATPALRTAFAWKSGGVPLQAVLRRVDAPLLAEDWRALAPEEQRARRARFLAEDARRGFDPARAPLTRAALVRLEDDAWWLVWSRHHLLLDGWSVTLVLRQWLAGYSRLARGLAPGLSAPPPFRAYVEWLRRQDEGRVEAFWRAELGEVEGPTALGLARPPGSAAPPGVQRHGEIEVALDPAESAAVQRLARAERITPAAIFSGAWALTMARLSGEREAVFGTTVAGRPDDLPGAEAMAGLFINTVPARWRLSSGLPAGAWLRAGQERAAAAREFGHAPLIRLQGWSGVPRDQPLFESLLVVENYPAAQALAALGDLRVEEARSHERTHYAATLIATPGEGASLRLLHDRGRLDDRAAAAWLAAFRAALAALAAAPERPVGGLAVAGAEQAAGPAGNPPPRPRELSATLTSLFAASAARAPEATAVRDGRRTLTYEELRRRSRALAARLSAAGAGPERCVGICLERSVDLVVAMLGVLESGAAYVPLDPVYPAERLAFMATDARLVALVTRRELEGRVTAEGAAVVRIEESAAEIAAAISPPLAANLAYLIYTSGSTGRPKAAAIEHRQAAALIDWALTAFSPAELSGVLFSTSICFDLSVFEVFVTLAAGGTIVVAENALALPEHPDRDRVTLLNTVPSAAAELARQEALRPPLSTICLAGEPLTAALADRLHALGVRRVCDLYGPSEDTTYSTYAQRVPGGPATIGRVIDHSRLYLLDDDLQPAPAGAIGEMHLAGDGLARGYLGRPELTAERFVPDPFGPNPGGRLYRTGDLARFRADGQLEFLGRRDYQVKIRGFRIELGEIQARLEAHPEVAEAAVLARDHPARGKYLAAYAAPKPGAAPTVERLAAWLRASLPAHMMPADWHLLPRLPRTPNGKLDRARLPASGSGASDTAAAAAPRPPDPVDEILAGIWADVLGVGRAGPDDNFFALGGHSLLATRAIARVRAALRADVPLRALFEQPTLAAFAAAVRACRLGLAAPSEPPIPARAPGTPPPLSFAQERMWALERLGLRGAAYHVPAVLDAVGALDLAALHDALAGVVRRHEALRAIFPERDGLASVVIRPEADFGFRRDDLSGLPEPERLAAARRIAAEEARAPFDLAAGPLARARLLVLGPDRHRLILTVHHIATDGWSEWVLVWELSELYAGHALDPLPVSYGDFAAWQRDRFERGEFAAELAWWTEELAGLGTLDLPSDATEREGRGGRVDRALAEVDAEVVRAAARAAGATLFMVLLAAWETWLWRRGGQPDFGIGVPVAGRQRRDLEPLIGLFVNTVVIRSDVAPGLDFSGLLAKVKERTLRAFDRQEAPFAQVVEAVQPRREAGRPPLFQTLFVLQNTPTARLKLGDVALESVPVETTSAKFDVTFIADERRDGTIGLSLEFSRDRFTERTAEAFLDDFAGLVRRLAADPGTRLREVGPAGGRAPDPIRVPPAEMPAESFAAPEGFAEGVLAGLWTELLHAPRVGRFDNFFALGGDSIIALQVAARAATQGLRVPPQAVFERQTLAELAGAAEAVVPGAKESRALAAAPGQPVPLTPIQQWFFEQDFLQPEHWNQSALFVTPPDFDSARFGAALRRVAERHDALHLRFRRGPGEGSSGHGWSAERGEPAASAAFESVVGGDLARTLERAQAGMNLAEGPLLRGVHVASVGGGEGRLFLVAHHLAIDVVSWRVLLGELSEAYLAGKAIAAADGAAAPAWAAWAQALPEAARNPESDRELEWWRAVPAGPELPRDGSPTANGGFGIAGDEGVEMAVLSDADTTALQAAAGEYQAQVNELLLAALAEALADWTGSRGHTIALEGHGREDFPGAPAVAGAVGWFTALYPLRVDAPAGGDPAATVRAAKAAFRASPRRGFGYGLLRYLGSAGAQAALRGRPLPELCFNYLGQLDGGPAPAAGFAVAPEARGAEHGAANARPFLIEVNAAIRGGRLEAAWSYSRAHHRSETIARLANSFAAHLRGLAAASPASGGAARAATDYSTPGLSQGDLDKILSRQR